MAKGRSNNNNSNSYEEARKQRLEENKKRFQDLGISKISKTLSEVIKPEKKSPVKNQIRYSSKMNLEMLELRRSSRARNPVVSYQDEAASKDLPHFRRRLRSSSSSTSYIARPLDEIKVATYRQRDNALKQAEILQSNLQSEHPSFVKSMVRSHVYSCFWLGLPSHFCKAHLPPNDLKMVLENENGPEYDAVYIGSRSGLSGGWRAFALDYKLDDGDALVFELTEPDRFRVYIVRAYADDDMTEASGAEVTKARENRIVKSKKGKKIAKNVDQKVVKRKEPMELSETSESSDEGPLVKKAKNNCKKVTFAKKLAKVMNSDADSCDHSIKESEEDNEAEETADSAISPKLQAEEDSNNLFRRRSSRLTKSRM